MNARIIRNGLGIVGRQSVAVRRPLSTTRVVGLKETSDPENTDYEKHKADSLSKRKQGQSHWKRELASDSEEALRADRSPPEDPAKLQERTKRVVESSNKEDV
ncbi:hypothetical protein GMORB2_2047 [Geosmithia morbida]|uniref:Uncharacterized protein n=1 Tax=Geosmithia morbida TaxID=1094350 RepID=A0A9P5D4M5_9HYPO|nr:uncharacterized protein GMORB2_2047 [Geosmithia morbida]KAF4121639.1 hypothetical protein GMORB2_2047 [Geosmithia morbida]